MGDDVIGYADAHSYFGTSVSLSDDGTRLAVGQPRSGCFQHINVECSGRVRVFELQSGSWVQIGSDIIGTLFDHTGQSVSLSGDGERLAVGSPIHSPGATESTGSGSQGSLYQTGRVSVYYWDTAVSEWSLLDDHIMSHSAINMAAGCTSNCGDYDKFG